MRLSLLIVLFYALVECAVAAAFLPKSFSATLEQQIQTTMFKKVNITKSDVEMKYLFPNHIYFNVKDEDSPVVYTCNKEKTWLYNPPFAEGEKGELTIGDSSKHCHVKMFDALSNGLVDNKIYKVKFEKSKAILLFSTKAQTQLSLSKIELEFKNKISKNSTISDISKMLVFKQSQKMPTTFVFKSLNTNAVIKKRDFTFKVPKNTNTKEI